jgi:hypothetical protein
MTDLNIHQIDKSNAVSPARLPKMAARIVLRGGCDDGDSGEAMDVGIEMGEQDPYDCSFDTGMRFVSLV